MILYYGSMRGVLHEKKVPKIIPSGLYKANNYQQYFKMASGLKWVCYFLNV